MKRQLPIHIIEGTEFIVDVQQGQLRQADKPENVILFEDMQYKESHYTFRYDLSTKNIPFSFTADPKNAREVQVPQMVTLDPAGMAEKYSIPVLSLKDKTDFDIIVDKKLLQERLNGKLPMINIAGHDFIVDFRLKELRPKDDFSTSIRLHDLHYVIEQEKYLAYYHPASHQVIDIDPARIKEVPRGVVLIEIPFERKLDPVAAAREYGMDYKDMLVKYPILKNLQANVIPIEQTNLPKLVKTNREREKQLEKNKLKKSLKRKRGKRI
ncbi:hypothetical protein [Rubrolithibacter danxiaensis]|uniref:hypothetical protein n=1 Tax=Rubrolithibacter danxiaensis TaxID=3390805 RepID=UPI003BF91A32